MWKWYLLISIFSKMSNCSSKFVSCDSVTFYGCLTIIPGNPAPSPFSPWMLQIVCPTGPNQAVNYSNVICLCCALGYYFCCLTYLEHDSPTHIYSQCFLIAFLRWIPVIKLDMGSEKVAFQKVFVTLCSYIHKYWIQWLSEF